MELDIRIKNPKKDILCYLNVVSTTDTYKESLIGKRVFCKYVTGIYAMRVALMLPNITDMEIWLENEN